MKIFEINSVPYGSTARIMLGIADLAQQNGCEVGMAAGYSYHPLREIQGRYMQVGTALGKEFHTLASRFTGLNGVYSRLATRRLLKKIDRFAPDILHLHNLHGWYLNLPMLFRYIKKRRVRVVWTLHDCWAFTGHCPHFDMIGCDKWRTGCSRCPAHREYPKTYIDRSATMYKRKKDWFTGVEDMTIVTPSRWLSDLVRQSFLGAYPVRVINNGIDLSVFRPVTSDFRAKYHCEDKRIILGVSFGWGEKKGLDVFRMLAKRLPEDYQIVLVGTDEATDKILPPEILSIHRTQDQAELAGIYAAADLFVNPTREENFPTVNIEALACGTPVLTFATGGSPEIIDGTCGASVAKNDADALEREILRICTERPYPAEACRKRAEQYDAREKFAEYLSLYGERKGT